MLLRRCHRNLANTIEAPALPRIMSIIPFDLIVFDLDGTLVDTGPDLTAALNHVLGGMGRQSVTEAAVRDMAGLGAAKLLERGLDATGGGSPDMVQAGLAGFLRYSAANVCVQSHPYQGVEQALDNRAARSEVPEEGKEGGRPCRYR